MNGQYMVEKYLLKECSRIRCLAVYWNHDMHHKSFQASRSLQAGNIMGSSSGS
jgi:hypothetical protein